MPLGLYCSKNWLCHTTAGLQDLQTLEFWSTIAASPVDSLFHTISLDNIHDAFHVGRGAQSFLAPLPLACSLVGIPCLVIAVPFLLWRLLPLLRLCANTYRVLTVIPYTVLGQPRLLGLSPALTISGLDLSASVGGTIKYLFLVDACNACYSSGMVLTISLLSLIGFPASQGLIEYARTVVALL